MMIKKVYWCCAQCNYSTEIEPVSWACQVCGSEDVLLDKISCIRWAKEQGFNLPDWCWQQLKEHDEKLNMNEKYKPCPFDGGKGYMVQSDKNNEWYARCRTCSCVRGGYLTKEEAIKAWETRMHYDS